MKKKVLIIDDHKLIYLGLKDHLDDAELLYAPDSRSALDIIHKGAIDFAIIDITIGRENGFDLAYNIRDRVSGIFFLSMHKSSLYVQKAIDEGYRGFFLKDESLEMLNDALADPSRKDFWMTDTVASLLSREGNHDTEQYERLSPREQQILRLLAEGVGYKEIGAMLNISAKTVNVHRANVMKKLGLEKQLDIVKYAIRIGLIDL